MSEQGKKWQRINDLLNAEAKPDFLCLPYTKLRKHFYRNKSFLMKRRNGELIKKRKEMFLTGLTTAIKDPQHQ